MVSFHVVFPRTSGYMSDRSSSPTSLDHIEASIFQREQGMRVAPVCLSRACQLINDMRKHPTKPQPLRRSTFLDMQKIHCHCLSSRHHDSGDICVLHSPPYPGKKKKQSQLLPKHAKPPLLIFVDPIQYPSYFITSSTIYIYLQGLPLPQICPPF